MAYLRRHVTAETELRAGRDAARAASLLKTSFVATISHDLRQPLHAISMFIGVLRRRTKDPAILSVVGNIATAVASMQRMFAALLDVARLDAGAIEIEPSTVPLAEVFKSLEVEFAASAAAKGLSLQIQPTTLSVATDPALLETILRNLLTNAVKFTDRGWVGIATRRRLETVEIIVFDTGIGIAAEDQKTIFGQFERLAQPGGTREGLGLGLSIVERTADLLSATVTLESRPGHGSQFTLSLPFAEPEQATAVLPVVREIELRSHRILVLDDHPDARKAVALAIETLGAIPMEAASPDDARRLLEEMAPEVPWAAVIDHDLGGDQTGPEFLDAYAASSGHALPAVIITGSTDVMTLAGLAASGRPWLIKPIELNTLCLALSRLVVLETV
jgi:CheY-like chemotaxis protein/anti-sigma regulatory factor (Ser/Thr protein kinase)